MKMSDFSTDAGELYIWATNTASVMAMHDHLAGLYEKRKVKGTYDRALAVKGMLNCADLAAKDYKRQFHHWFAPSVRKECAEMLLQGIECEWNCGNSWL